MMLKKEMKTAGSGPEQIFIKVKRKSLQNIHTFPIPASACDAPNLQKGIWV